MGIVRPYDSAQGLGEALFPHNFKHMKSDKPVLPQNKVFGKRMFVFPKEYGTENIGGKRGMVISINGHDTFVPVDEPVDLTYDVWMLLKNIGRIGRIVTVEHDKKV